MHAAGQLRQTGVDLRISTVVQLGTDLSCQNLHHHQPQRTLGNHTPRVPAKSAAAVLEAKTAIASLLSKAPARATWYSDLVTPTPAPKRTAPMRPPSPRPMRSLRNSRRQSETKNGNSDIPAVAKHAHVATEDAPGVGPGLRTRARRRAAMKHSPSDPASSHDTASVTLCPATPSQRHEWRQHYALRQRKAHPNTGAVETDVELWADEENGPSQANLVSEVPSANNSDDPLDTDCSPHLTCFPAQEHRTTPWSSPTMTPVRHLVDLPTESLTKRLPLQDATWSLLHDPMMSPAMRPVGSGLDLSRLDDSAVALSPITSGLSPLALGLADFPSPLTALPALMSPLPDTLQV